MIKQPAAEVFRLLTTTGELTQWFAEQAAVDLEKGVYGFWGRHSPGVPQKAAQQLRSYEDGRSLSYDWHVNGNDTEVEFELEDAPGGCIVRLTTHGNREWEAGHGSMTDFWVAALDNLRLHAMGHTGLLLCDYTHVQGTVACSVDIAAGSAEVWRGLTDPAQLDRYFASAAEVQLSPGGVFSYGWEAGGPQRVLSVEPGSSLTVSWIWGGEGESQVRWQLEDSGGRTRLNLVHSGFGDRKSQDYQAGWTSFLVSLKAMLELGSDWSKVETDGYVPDGATA
jgi:uncharacterized protein YndB with AHSA1/START domain